MAELSAHTPIKILHVEDCDRDAILVKAHLKKARFNIDEQLCHLKSLEQALDFLGANSVDVVLLDLFLPDSSGLETLSRLQTFSPENSIIVLSGTDDEAIALKAVNKGAQDYLVKDEINSRSISRAIRYSMERHCHDKKILELASIDLLTGLSNRARFMEHLDQAIEASHRLDNSLSLLFIDVDGFKLINDTYGHLKGDQYLVTFAQRLRSSIRSSDFLARMSGDEFVILIPHIEKHPTESIAVAEKVLNSLNENIVTSMGESIQARCSIGITTYDGVSTKPSAEKLIQEADAAMYVSKKRGGNCFSFFDTELEQMSERRAGLFKLLTNALKQQSFTLAYQPIIDTKTSQTAGLEVLLRWTTEKGEVIPPYQFIPLLEESGAIKSIGYWILKESCSNFMELQNSGALSHDAWISINISPIQLQQTDFAEQLTTILTDLNFPPELVHLEITESVLLEHNSHTLELLNNVKELGCQWVIDDFGIGYSSMSYLKNLPVSILKIDQSFVRNCCEGPKDLGITKAMIALAHNLDMSVVAEGVETLEIADLLTKEGCEYIQGYYFSRPMPFETLSEYLGQKTQSVV